jgi:hypothetical protein
MLKPRALMGLLVVFAGCGQSGSPQEPPDVRPLSPPKAAPQKPPGNVPKGVDYGVSEIPRGAQFTIYCAAVRGDFHVERAVKMKKDLIQATGMKDWYVVSEDAQSVIYYGYYRVIRDASDKPESDRAQRDRLKIDQMTDPMGNRPFAQAMFVRLDAPDPEAPPEWNLVNAKGYWTIEIGAYMNNPQRKQAAVDAVRAARAQGIEAYYYHGPTASSVCVGSWPMEAVKRQQTGERGAESRNPDQDIMVLPPGMPHDLAQRATALAQERNLQVLTPKLEVTDPTLRDAIRQFPTYAVNGMEQTHNVNGVAQTNPSQLIAIPRQVAARDAPAHAQGQSQFDPTYRPDIPRQTPPHQPVPSGGGRLKSIGD